MRAIVLLVAATVLSNPTSEPAPAPCAIGAEPVAYARLTVVDAAGQPTGSVVDTRCPGRVLVAPADAAVALLVTGSEVAATALSPGQLTITFDGAAKHPAKVTAPDLSVTISMVGVGGGNQHDLVQFVRSL